MLFTIRFATKSKPCDKTLRQGRNRSRNLKTYPPSHHHHHPQAVKFIQSMKPQKLSEELETYELNIQYFEALYQTEIENSRLYDRRDSFKSLQYSS